MWTVGLTGGKLRVLDRGGQARLFLPHSGANVKVLVVDDVAYSRRALRSVFLSAGYAVLAAEDGERALEIAREERPDLIVTDILMPRLDGFQLCRAIKTDPVLQRVPVIFYTGSYGDDADRELGLSLGAAAYLVKPLEPKELIEAVTRAIGIAPADLKRRAPADDWAQAYADRLAKKLQEKVAELDHTIERLDEVITGTVAAFGLILAERDGSDPIDAERPARLAQLFTERVDPELAADPNVFRGFLLHDISKLMVPDPLLAKRVKLNPDEWAQLHRWRDVAADILRNVPGLGRAIEVVRHCHEHWDGTGHPGQLKGEQIPMPARIFALADTFEAITRGRPWSPRRGVPEAIAELRRCAGTQFDPDLVEPFIKMITELQPQ
jgi:putative two-component system response regulator